MAARRKKTKARKSDATQQGPKPVLPSIYDLVPLEQGGPIARSGFTYQDHVAVFFLLEMLKEDSLLEVWYETHDDITLIWSAAEGVEPEFVQVKAVDNDQFWSIALLCGRESAGKGKAAKVGSSILEKSLGRAGCGEAPRFRIVTTNNVKGDLRPLTYPPGTRGLKSNATGFKKMVSALLRKLPNPQRAGGRDVAYWAANTFWDVKNSKADVRAKCVVAIHEIAGSSGTLLFSDQADKVMNELLRIAKEAGDAPWLPDPNLSKFKRSALCNTWRELLADATRDLPATTSKNLELKMGDADLETTQIESAKEVRRSYAQAMRRSTYMDVDNHRELPQLVLAEMSALYSKLISGEIAADGRQFHEVCLAKIAEMDNRLPGKQNWRSSFLRGAMYDMTDRCQHRFSKRTQK